MKLLLLISVSLTVQVVPICSTWDFSSVSDSLPIIPSWKNSEEQLLNSIALDLIPTTNPLDQLRDRIRNQLRQYVEEVQAVHSQGQPSHTSRHKRDVIQADELVPNARRRRNYEERPYELSLLDEGSSEVVKRIYLMSKPSFTSSNISDLNVINYSGNLYAFVVDYPTSSTNIYKLDSNWNLEQVGRLHTPGARMVETFKIDGSLYVLPATFDAIDEATLDGGSTLYRVDLVPNFRVIPVQTFDTHNARSISFWRSSGVAANDVILCVAPEKQVTLRGDRYQVNISCYRWQGGYFDLTHLIPAQSPQALQYMSIASHSYLCIANYKDDTGSTKVYSTILRYSHKKENYVPFQKILTYGAKDCKYFRFDSSEQTREHYLAIANHGETDRDGRMNHNVNSYIYKYGIGRFILFQRLVTYGAFQILPINYDQKFLLIIAEINKLSIYQHNGWNFVKTRHIDVPHEQLANQFRMRSVSSGGQLYFTAASPELPEETGIYGIEFESKNDYLTVTSDLAEWCWQAVENIQNTNLPQLVHSASSAPNVTEPEIVVKGPLTISSPLRAQSISTESLTYAGSTFDADRSKSLAGMERHLHAMEEEFPKIWKQLDGVLLLDGDQTVKTPLTFSSLTVSNDSKVDTKDLDVGFINQVNAKELLEKVIFLDRNYHITKLNGNLLDTKHEISTTNLNGKKIAELVLKSVEGPQKLSGNNEFRNTLFAAEGVQLEGSLNAVKVSQILTSNPEQTFEEMTIDYSFLRNINTSIVNGLSINQIIEESVRRSGNESMRGKKTFKNLKIESIWAEPLLSGFNIPDLYSNAVFKDKLTESSFEGSPEFESISVTNLFVNDERINGVYNLSDFLSITSGAYHGHSWTINGDVASSNVVVKSTINDLDPNTILLKNTAKMQTISGHSLNTILLKVDSDSDGTINGIDFTKWKATEVVEFDHVPMDDGNIVASKVTFVRGVTVEKELFQERHSVIPILQHMIPLNSSSFHCKPSSITFEFFKVKGNAEVGTINEESPQDWVNRNDPQTVRIDAPKQFFNNVTFMSPVTAQAVYPSSSKEQEALAILHHAVMNGTNQTLNSKFTFAHPLTVRHLSTLPDKAVLLDGTPLGNILKTTKPHQVIEVKSITKIIKSNALQVEENVHANQVNGININHAWNDTLRTGSPNPQVFTGNMRFTEGLFVQDMHSPSDQYDTSGLLGNIVLNGDSESSSEPAAMQGSLRLLAPAELKEVDFVGTMNGITPDQLGAGWLTKAGDQDISTPFHFAGNLEVSWPHVTDNKVSGVDIKQLNEETLRKNQDGSVGVATFESDVEFTRSVCSKDFNGFNPDQDILRKDLTSLQEITGRKRFLENWEIIGNLEAKDIPGVVWDKLIDFAVGSSNPNESLEVHGNCDTHFESGPPETINGIPWEEITKNVWFQNQDAVFTGEVHFDNLHVPGGELHGRIDGVDLSHLQTEYLSRTKNQSWSGDFVFEGNVCAKDIKAEEVIIQDGTLNGIRVETFSRSVLLTTLDQDVNTKMSFKKLYSPTLNLNSINGLDFCSELVRIHGDNHVPSKHIAELDVESLTLSPDAVVNGVGLGTWRSNSALTQGDFTLERDLNMSSAEFYYLLVMGLVDGKSINKVTVMTLSGDQTGSGNFTFNGPQGTTKFSDIRVSGNVNGYDLNNYFNNLVVRDGDSPITFHGRMIFDEDVSAAWVKADDIYDPHGTELKSVLQHHDPEFYSHDGYIEHHYDNIRNATLGLIHIATERAVLPFCFEESNVVPLENVVKLKVSHLLNVPMVALVTEVTQGQQAQWWAYNVTLDRYEPCKIQPAVFHGEINDISEIRHSGQNFVFISATSKNGENVTSELTTQPAKRNALLSSPSGAKLSRGYVLRLANPTDGTFQLVIQQVIHADAFGSLITFHLVTSSGSVQDCVLYSALDKDAYAARLYCFRPLDQSRARADDNAVYFVQRIPLNTFPLLTSIMVGTKTLVIMSEDYAIGRGKLLKNINIVRVFAHNQGDESELEEEDGFPVMNVVSIDSIQAPNYHPFLVVVSGRVDRSAHQGLVYIYKYSTSQQRFVKFQTILEDNPIQARFQRIEPSDELFLYIMNENTRDNVKVYVFKGVAGWNEEYAFTAVGSGSLEISEFFHQNEYRAHVLTPDSKKVNMYDVHFNGVPFVPSPV